MKKSPSSLGLCALIVLAVSSGCRAPVTCSEIVDTRPTTAPFGNVTLPDTERWMIDSYGPPAAYQAGYEPAPVAGTSLYLYYPQAGLVISGRRNTTNRSIGNGFEMSAATFIAPAKSAVDMLPAIHSPPGEWPRFSEAASLRPWPADLRDIVLDVHPAYQ